MKLAVKYLGVFLAGLILASPVMMVLPLQNEAHALPGPYFKTLTIQGGNVSSANYTMVPITIHSGNGTDNATDYYLQGQGAFSDFRDVSFTDELGNTLPFFAENYPPLEHGGVSQPIYSRINDPSSIEYTYNGTIYTVVVWQSGLTTLDPYISQLNHSTGNWTFPLKMGTSTLIGDDHGAPSVFRDNLGYFHVAFGSHGGNFQILRSTNPNDISQWTEMADITSVGGATYPRWLQTSNNTLVFSYRGTSGLSLAYRTSINNGTTWSAEVPVVEANAGNVIYAGNVVYDSSNNTLNVAWTTYNGTAAKRQHLYEAYKNLNDGNIYTMAGVNLGSTVNETEANTSARIYTSTGIFEVNIPALRLDNNNVPYVFSTIQDGTGYHHEWSTWNGTGWNPFAIVANTADLFNLQDFRVATSSNITAYLVTGGQTDYNNFSGLNRGGDLTKYSYNGTAWASTSILTSQNSSFALNIPTIVYGSNTTVIFPQVATEQYGYSDLQLFYYDGSTVTPIIPKTHRVWVNVNNIPQSPATTTARMYYGNPTAVSTSNAASTFIKYNDGITGNFTTATLGGASVANFPIPKTLQATETLITDAYAYGVNMSATSGNLSIEFIDVRNTNGSDAGVMNYAILDATTVAGTIGATPAIDPTDRFIVARYNNQIVFPNQIAFNYVNGAGTYLYWNGTGWDAVGVRYNVSGPINIRIAISGDTIYAYVTQSGRIITGNVPSIALSSVKAFTNGKVFVQSDRYTNFYYSNTSMSAQFLRPYMNPEPQWLGSMPNLSTGTSNVSVNKDGITSVNVTGIFADIGSTPTQGWVEYGLTAGYGNTTANVTYTTNGTKSVTLPTNLMPGQTYHWRFRATSAGGTSNGTDSTFSLTLPSVTTGTPTNVGEVSTVIPSNVTSKGVASNFYAGVQYGSTNPPTTYSTEQTLAVTGNYNTTISGYDSTRTLYWRSFTRVGSVYSYGSVHSVVLGRTNAYDFLRNVLTLAWAAVWLIAIAIMLMNGSGFVPMIVACLVGAVGIAIIRGFIF